MNPEFKKLWIEALRSGKYKQGQGVLSSGDEFCCLGVLCEVVLEKYPESISVDRNRVHTHYNECSTHLPQKVEQLCEFSRMYNFSETLLMEMNDVHKKSFNDIADYIEEKF